MEESILSALNLHISESALQAKVPFNGKRWNTVCGPQPWKLGVQPAELDVFLPMLKPRATGFFEDWNNVATLQDFTPYGLPAGSRPHNDSAGIYGQVGSLSEY